MVICSQIFWWGAWRGGVSYYTRLISKVHPIYTKFFNCLKNNWWEGVAPLFLFCLGYLWRQFTRCVAGKSLAPGEGGHLGRKLIHIGSLYNFKKGVKTLQHKCTRGCEKGGSKLRPVARGGATGASECTSPYRQKVHNFHPNWSQHTNSDYSNAQT
jgi:hypothetical protein